MGETELKLRVPLDTLYGPSPTRHCLNLDSGLWSARSAATFYSYFYFLILASLCFRAALTPFTTLRWNRLWSSDIFQCIKLSPGQLLGRHSPRCATVGSQDLTPIQHRAQWAAARNTRNQTTGLIILMYKGLVGIRTCIRALLAKIPFFSAHPCEKKYSTLQPIICIYSHTTQINVYVCMYVGMSRPHKEWSTGSRSTLKAATV